MTLPTENITEEHSEYAVKSEQSPPPEGGGQPETPFRPIDYADLARSGLERGPAVIDGIQRQGSAGTLISSSKARKSWAVAALIAAVLEGTAWFGHKTTRGRVLLVDGELTLATIKWRLNRVFQAMGIGQVPPDRLHICCLRGRTREMPKAMHWARTRGPGYFASIIVDPLSCFYPSDPETAPFDENSNADMRRLMDDAITFAEDTRAALTIVHHASKGSQFEKAVIDVGSGAGALVRAVDAHLVFRPHREIDCVVLDGVVRDFPELLPTCYRWSFPLYIPAPELNPNDLAGRRPPRNQTQNSPGDGKSKPTPPTLDEFIMRYVSSTPKELAFIQAQARQSDLRPKTTEQLLREAVAVGKAFKITVKPGKPTSYTTARPSQMAFSLSPSVPPIPPVGAKSTTGRGSGSKKKKPTDAGMRTPNTEGRP